LHISLVVFTALASPGVNIMLDDAHNYIPNIFDAMYLIIALINLLNL